MAEGKKISELNEVSSVTDNDEFIFVDKEGTGSDSGTGGKTAKITFANLKSAIGPVGQKGEAGEKGDKGDLGPQGSPGEGADSYWSTGSVADTIGYAGSVGVGTTEPVGKLHIETSDDGTALGPDVILMRESTNPVAGGLLGSLRYQGRTHSANGAIKVDYADIKAEIADPAGGGKLVFRTRQENTGNHHTMVLDNNGNVGIGTDSPDHPLDVRGNFAQFHETGAYHYSNFLAYGGTVGVTSQYRMGNEAGDQNVQISCDGDSYFKGGSVLLGDSAPIAPVHADNNQSPTATLHVKSEGEDRSIITEGDIIITKIGPVNQPDLVMRGISEDNTLSTDFAQTAYINKAMKDSSGNPRVPYLFTGLREREIDENGSVFNSSGPSLSLHAGSDAVDGTNSRAQLRAQSRNGWGGLFRAYTTGDHSIGGDGSNNTGATLKIWANNDAEDAIAMWVVNKAHNTSMLTIRENGDVQVAGVHFNSHARGLYGDDTRTNAGFVGIGTNDPVRKLHVASKLVSQPEFLAGTITINTGVRDKVEGSGCAFTTDFEEGDTIGFTDSVGQLYKRTILSIEGDNSMTLQTTVWSAGEVSSVNYFKCLQETDTEMVISGPDEAGTGLFLGTSGKYNDGFPFKVTSGHTNAGDGDGTITSYITTSDAGIESCSRLVSSNGNLIVGTHNPDHDFMVQTGGVRRLQIVDSGSASSLYIYTSAIRDRSGGMMPGIGLLNQEIEFPITSQNVVDSTGETNYQDILVFKTLSSGYNGRGAGRIHISFTGGYHSPNTYTLDFFKSYSSATPSISNLRNWGGGGYITSARAVSYTKNGELYHAIQIKLTSLDRSSYPDLTYMSKFTVQVEAIGYNPSSGFGNDKYVPYDNAAAVDPKFKSLTVTAGPIDQISNSIYGGAGQTAQLVGDYQGSKGEFLTDEDKKLAQSVIDGSYSAPQESSQSADLLGMIETLKSEVESLKSQLKGIE